MDRAAFRELLKNPRTIIGASLLIQAPTGQYESDRLINNGTNRWSVKPANRNDRARTPDMVV